MKKVRVITAEEAALMVKDGDTVSTGGFVSCACPEALTKALENRFVETGHPRDLTLFFAAGQGHRDGTGGDHFGHEGMCKRVVGGHWDRAAKLGELALANKLEAYNLPQGVITHMYRDIAAHNIGTITHVGLNTFVDPRHEGGKLNECTKEDLVKLVNIDGEERLLYKPIPINVCLVRGSYADEYGNCTVHREIGPLDVTAQCQATKNSGGIVIVQVEKIVQGGTLDPRLVKIPGIYVDAIVVGSPEENNQCLGMPYDGALSGEFRIPVDDIPPIPMDAKKIIARRAAMELPQDAIVNLGTGAPEKIANVCAEEGISNKMTLTVEAGSIAGVPYGGTQFGGAANSMAILDHNVQFDFYQGGGLDVAQLRRQPADVVHISPSHHYPTGIVMPIARRQELLRWAAEEPERYILEDDYDSEFRFVGRPIPTLFSVSENQRVIYLNTFSKTIAPSIRISYMILPPRLLARYREKLGFYACTVSSFEQYTLARFLEQGRYEQHLNRMKTRYRQKRDAVIDAIRRSPLSDRAEILEQDAGLHFLMVLPTDLDDRSLRRRAEAMGLRLALLSDYYSQPAAAPQHILVVNYAGIDMDRLPEGLRRLAQLWEEPSCMTN